ncbi:MAG: DUF1667 domain-containing protein [Treponema sp.]|jgi:CxxC motif-containing protein|nr:DUF1667 domain-containing protein [Treponema sp.]
MRIFTGIGYPRGCSLRIAPEPREAAGRLAITGNRCQRGTVYAQEEVRSPKRVVTATCAIAWSSIEGKDARKGRSLGAPRRFPVKPALPCPKERIPELPADRYRIRLRMPVKTGDTVIADWRGTGIRVVAVRSIGYLWQD